MENLDKFGRPYPPKKGLYYVPSVTTDAVVIRQSKANSYDILMITRGNSPFKDCYALPGGFLDYNEEPSKGCLRELKEETNLDGISCELLTVKGDPLRDPRGHIVSIVFLVSVSSDAIPKGGDDAAFAKFYDLNEILNQKEKIAFDHYEILKETLKKLQNDKLSKL